MMKRDEIIAKATELINGDRKEDYGDSYLNHMRIAEFWNNYLDHEIKITPTDVALMMMLVKIARCMHTYKDDSLVDMCGYAALAGEMSNADVKRPDWG